MDNQIKAEEYKPKFLDRIKWKTQDINYWIKNKILKTGLFLVRLSSDNSNLVKHTENEFKALNWPGDCEMQTMVCDNVIDLVTVFSTQGHSGSSAPYVINLFKRLADFEPIAPLTGADSEWNKIGDNKYQNCRCSHVFKDEDGKPYDSLGKVFREPNGCCYTSRDSRVYITFPYKPETKYIDVPENT